MPKIKLNQNQEKAVKHKNGPLIVVAGAGTGKTRVITERIKRLIQEDNHDSNELLALTFTEKAAQEMKERVGDAMPLGYEEPWINTFHSFADRILRKEGLEIGLDPSYQIISTSHQWILLRQNLFKMNLKYYLPLGNPTKFISAILKFISRLQDENITSENFSEFTKNISKDDEEKEKWEELSRIYKRYQDLKIQNSKMDFGDLIMWLIKLFQERPAIANKYKEQFKHILVDEFQDTNYAQYILLKMLFPSEEKDRSLVVVGDDSQSIYKFRGAAISNIMEFRKDFPSSDMITLYQNYRSTQKILDASYKVVQKNNPYTLESKLGISKELISEIDETEGEISPLIFETINQEVDWIVKKIYEILAKEPTYTYKDIAILARANSHLDPFVLGLRNRGLPYQLVGNRGLYDQDEIRDVLALLKVIINPNDSINLYRVLNISSFKIGQDAVTHLLSQAKYKKQDLWEIANTYLNENVQEITSKIKSYQEKISKTSPVDFVYSLLNETKYVTQYIENETIENHLKMKNLDLFLEIVKNFEVEYRKDTKEIPNIINFVDHLEMLIEAGDNPAQAEIEDIDTINLLTVHASKGLEFPIVFLINTVAGRFPSRNRTDPIEIPDELIKETLPTGNEHIQEERRLFYVGMTRAQKYLYMTMSKNYGGKKEYRPSGYVEETNLKIKEVEGKDPNNGEKQKTLFEVDSKYRDPIHKKIDFTPKFLSFSQIDTYKTCGLMYKYRYVLNVPTPPGHALSFGITVHDTLRDFHNKLLFKSVSKDELHQMYEKNWQPLGYDNKEHRDTRYEAGLELLDNYYDEVIKESKKPLALEKSFNIKISGIKFFGRIDRIDPLDEEGVEIIDYKTGGTKTQKYVDKDDQVTFYAIAAKEALGLNPKKLTYHFLESGEKISTTRTQEELEEKKSEVAEVIEEIKSGKFNATPGMHCNWCDFKDICPYAYKGGS